MRPIKKRTEPDSLTQHRSKSHSNYDNYAAKDDLRESLVAEQGAICCYCMQRIHAERTRMKIEHWACQEDHSDQDLNYDNLLGACPGGEGKPGHLQHCDTSKGKKPLRRNPAVNSPLVDRDVRYLPDGTMTSDDAAFDGELNDVLHLNIVRLKNNRKAVLDALHRWAETFPKLRKTDVKAELKEWGEMEGGHLREYVQVAIYWLTKRLSKF